MVTQLFTDAGQTWRAAARVNSRGRTIYEALRRELQGPINGSFYSEINRNAEIIKTIPQNFANKMTKYIAEESIKGRRASDIAEDIKKRFPQGEANINLIARTEVSKTSTALTQARSEEIGLRWYVWKNSEDERVRHSHEGMGANGGVLINWNEAPDPEKLFPEKGVRPYGEYHAGCTFNCRCYPEPLISIDDIQWPHKVLYGGSIKTMTRAQFASMNVMPNSNKQPEKKPEPMEEDKKTFTPARNIKEAEIFSSKVLKITNVNLNDFDLQAANDINKHFSKLQKAYPEVFTMQKLSSCQQMFKDKYDKEFAFMVDEYVKMGYNRSRAEELAEKYTKRRKISSGTIALSIGGNSEFNGISFNQKYYKTAKGYAELKEISKKSAQAGYWSHGDPNGVITHEFGHQIMNYLESKHMGRPIEEIFKQFRQEVADTKAGIQGYRDLLSEYGNTNVREFFAEAFREYIESENPRKYAQQIGKIVENAFANLRRRN